MLHALIVLPLLFQDPLPGTARLEGEKDFASEMVAGIDRFLLREIDRSVERRAKLWKRDFSSREAYDKSVQPNRERLRKYIGAIDDRVAPRIDFIAGPDRPALVGEGDGFQVFAIRWPVFRGVEGEGLLLVPAGKPAGSIVAIPDADQTPEALAGLTPGLEASEQSARLLAQAGFRVAVPTLIDRADTYSVSSVGKATNQPHREFVYRPAFEMGRHIIGYEVQKVLALVDGFARDGDPVGVAGGYEGGLIALYAAALDTRIQCAVIRNYLASRQRVWEEPIYRNVWGLLEEFGDAEIVSLIHPREPIFNSGAHLRISGPPPARAGRGGAAPGAWTSPDIAATTRELERLAPLFGGKDLAPKTPTPLADLMNRALFEPRKAEPPRHLRKDFDPQPRLKRQFDQLVEDTQVLLRDSEGVRKKLWAKMDTKSLEGFERSTEAYREQFYSEVIGRFDEKLLAANPRTRKVYDEPAYTGYEVVLDVWEDVFAYGILLVPKGIKEGERRPVVVCQHGLEGRPQDVADPKKLNKAYNQYACRLAERGFVTYAPQNPYIFTDRFRTLQRKANLLRKTLFSIIVPQHQQTTDWLASLPFVDPTRVAFYGLSYGGKTAMRVPPLVPRYCLSICSADFNEWIWKNASTRSPYSYVTTGEYEIFEWDLGNTFNYAEMACLIAPRPFMVERGHHDGVAPDEQVAYEYAKIRRLYAALKIPDRTTIEFFDGPHSIHGVGTFDFLHEHLKWPKPAK